MKRLRGTCMQICMLAYNLQLLGTNSLKESANYSHTDCAAVCPIGDRCLSYSLSNQVCRKFSSGNNNSYVWGLYRANTFFHFFSNFFKMFQHRSANTGCSNASSNHVQRLKPIQNTSRLLQHLYRRLQAFLSENSRQGPQLSLPLPEEQNTHNSIAVAIAAAQYTDTSMCNTFLQYGCTLGS